MNQNKKASISILTISGLTLMAVFISKYSLLYGSLLFCSLIWGWFSIFHSCGHNSYFKNRQINDVIGYIASGIILVPYYSWKIHHATHHKWTGYIGKDPTSADIKLPEKEKMLLFQIMWKAWIPFISCAHVVTHLWNPSKVYELTKNNKSLKTKTLLSFLIIPIFHVIMAATVGKIFYLPWISAMLFFLVTSDIILISQHGLIPMKKVNASNTTRPLPVGQHQNYTRSISFGYFIDRYILLNFGEHSRHHLFPLRPHFDLSKTYIQNEKRVNGWKWILEIKKMHIYDILNPRVEAGDQ